MRGANGTNGQPGRPSRGPPRGKGQVFTTRSSDLFGSLTEGVVEHFGKYSYFFPRVYLVCPQRTFFVFWGKFCAVTISSKQQSGIVTQRE